MERRHLISCLIISICFAANADVYHTVKPGETLYRLSREYGVSVDELKEINRIKNVSDIPVGTRLLIKKDENAIDSYISYTVKRGDTLYSIARKNDMGLAELLRINGLIESHILQVGEVLQLKLSEDQTQKTPTAVVENPQNTDTTGNVQKNAEYFWPHQGEQVPLNGKLVGKEINGRNGDPIVSVSSGKVIWVAPYHGYGKIIMVESPDKHIFAYGGNGDTLVNVGDRVRPGQKLGLLGSGGIEGEAKAFFFVYKNGKPVDPESAPRK
ncbi:LysM peptidoglycan-binding domain-containing M23 family metallopeptidase [Marispirochaeta sp.]|jgi:LysM repeat protein|uniref:LysM peptidoglycan-binding domain-containing M23 family metallopeptidase n=1 Tax=Marispirochaeta sp. TaxID=2038653 RepID=UPI0029C910CA|nr:LysM peptidoglycan-binding domain-containing M23 family metallopeptidase [Marispirochaeta sp.]